MNGIGKNLKRVRLLKNLSLKEAGKLLNMTAPAVSKYEKGQIIPDSKKVIEFANAYQVKTYDILKSYNTPKMEFKSFRKLKKLSGQNLKLLEEIVENEVAKYLEVLEMNDLQNNKMPLKKYDCTSYEEAEKIAQKFRNEVIGISNKIPISDLTSVLENMGINVIYIENINNKFIGFDGLCEIVDSIPFIVLLNDITDGARQRFTIAHELGHLILNCKNTSLDEEKMCNRFASSLLMPKEAVINEFGSSRKNINFYEFKAFKNEYKVSYSATNYRLKELDIISEYLYKNINIFLSKNIGKNDPEPISPEKSYQFKKLVYKLEASKIINFKKACELLGISEDEYYNQDYNYRH